MKPLAAADAAPAVRAGPASDANGKPGAKGHRAAGSAPPHLAALVE